MLIIAETQWTTVMFLVGLAITSGLLLVRTQRQIRKTSPAPAAKRSSPTKSANVATGPSSQARWEVQMHDLARELSGQLDSKISVLQHLLGQAAEQTARLEALLARAQRLTQAAAIEPASTSAARRSGTQAAALGSAANVRIDSSSRAEPASAGSRRQEQIYRLADAGQTSAAIAAQLGSPIGEVELILGLRRQGS